MIQISQRLSLQQKQSPQQVLLSTLLQLPVLRLEQRIKQELELNPLLELEMEYEGELLQEEEQELEQKEEKEKEEAEAEADRIEKEPELQEKEQIDWDSILNDENDYEIKAPKEPIDEDIEHPEPAPVTLMDHLMEQLHLAPLTPLEMQIGEYLLWCIDDVGYLTCDIETVAEQFRVTPDEVEKVLQAIQRFDPVGIGARNLRECLLIQLEEKTPRDPFAIRMLEECYDDFSNKRFEKIAKKLDIPLDQVKAIMENVAKLNTKPGERYVT